MLARVKDLKDADGKPLPEISRLDRVLPIIDKIARLKESQSKILEAMKKRVEKEIIVFGDAFAVILNVYVPEDKRGEAIEELRQRLGFVTQEVG